jgi:transcriptional antiterminator RfaH
MTPDDAEKVRWFCLKSQPKHEHIAAAHLRQMTGVEVFCPRLRFKRPTVRGPKWFEEAMFPGYLFSRFHFAARHKEVRYAMGISNIVRFGEHYAAIDDSVIASLRETTNGEQIAVIESDIKVGDNVKIVEGTLRGLEAVVTNILSGRERVRVLLNFLGREIQAELQRPAVLPAKRHPLAA